MSSIIETLEALLLLFVLMLPVLGIAAVLFAAHMLGGAMKAPRRKPRQIRSRSLQRPSVNSRRSARRDANTSHAA